MPCRKCCGQYVAFSGWDRRACLPVPWAIASAWLLAFPILSPWFSGFGIPHTNLYLKFTQPYLLTVRLSKVYIMTGEYSVLHIYSFLSMDILVSPSGSHLVWVGTGSIGKARAESGSNTPSSHIQTVLEITTRWHLQQQATSRNLQIQNLKPQNPVWQCNESHKSKSEPELCH